jgi:hypothetical protein
MSEIVSLDLSASIVDQSGLNLAGRDLLKCTLFTRGDSFITDSYDFSVFSKPNSFVFLSFMTIDNAPISDFDITYIHHLPRLSILSLCNAGLGNEASEYIHPSNVVIYNSITPQDFTSSQLKMVFERTLH